MSDKTELELLQQQLKEAETQLIDIASLFNKTRQLMDTSLSVIEDIRIKIQVYHLTHGK